MACRILNEADIVEELKGRITNERLQELLDLFAVRLEAVLNKNIEDIKRSGRAGRLRALKKILNSSNSSMSMRVSI